MAIYEGARPRPLGLAPRPRRLEAPVMPRRRMGRVRRVRRSNRIAFLLGGIVLAFVLAFFSLAQTMQVAATGYEIDRLQAEAAQLEAERRELVSDLNRLGREPAIRRQAIDAGLAPLGKPLDLPSQ